MNARQKAALYTQLATLARAGVPLHQATAALRPYFKQAPIRALVQALEEGRPLSSGMEEAGFRPFEMRMVLAGEQTGRLERIFQQLAEYWESEADLKSSIRRQCLYPVLLLHLAALAVPAGLLTKSFSLYLFSVAWHLLAIYAAVFAGFLFFSWCWKREAGQKLILRIPVLGKALRSAAAWRWVQVAEIEFSAGIPLPESIRDAWMSTGWVHAAARAETAMKRLNEGENLSLLYREWPELPPEWEMFLLTGENAGKLHESLAQLVAEARRNWGNTRKALAEWLPRIFYAGIMILVIFQVVSAYRNYLNKLLDM